MLMRCMLQIGQSHTGKALVTKEYGRHAVAGHASSRSDPQG